MDGPPSHTPPGVGGRAKVGEMEGGWGREKAILVAALQLLKLSKAWQENFRQGSIESSSNSKQSTSIPIPPSSRDPCGFRSHILYIIHVYLYKALR